MEKKVDDVRDRWPEHAEACAKDTHIQGTRQISPFRVFTILRSQANTSSLQASHPTFYSLSSRPLHCHLYAAQTKLFQRNSHRGSVHLSHPAFIASRHQAWAATQAKLPTRQQDNQSNHVANGATTDAAHTVGRTARTWVRRLILRAMGRMMMGAQVINMMFTGDIGVNVRRKFRAQRRKRLEMTWR